jgi:perosamine synthetase
VIAARSSFIPLSVPEIRGAEWDYVKECLDTGWVSSAGKFVERFEQSFIDQVGSTFAIACVNGTSAIHTALLVAGVRPGDAVIVSTLTFIAPVNAIRYCNAEPIVIDATETDWQLDVEAIRALLEASYEPSAEGPIHRESGQRIAALLPVHILGTPVDLQPLMELARKWGIPVVEDSTESLGATYQGVPTGRIGDLGCFSFNGNKLITTGGGGMIVTSNPDYAQRCRHLTTQAKLDEEEFIHDEVGYNYRLTNVAAAIGVAQMEQLDAFLEAKRRISTRYREAFAGHDRIECLPVPENRIGADWLFTIRLRGQSSRPLLQHLKAQAIQTRPLWQPLHRSPAHPSLHATQCPTADVLNDECLSIPCSVGLCEGDQEAVIHEILQHLRS